MRRHESSLNTYHSDARRERTVGSELLIKLVYRLNRPTYKALKHKAKTYNVIWTIH